MSKHRKSTFGLQLSQLADLFAIAAKDHSSRERDGADKCPADLLRSQLMEVMTGDCLLFRGTSETSAGQKPDMTSLAGRSLLEVLFSPETTIGQLQLVKEASKRLTTMSISEAEQAVATTIYHAAIARCLVQHGKKITQHSYEKLDESFALLLDKKWMACELVELFSEARQICQSNRSKK